MRACQQRVGNVVDRAASLVSNVGRCTKGRHEESSDGCVVGVHCTVECGVSVSVNRVDARSTLIDETANDVDGRVASCSKNSKMKGQCAIPVTDTDVCSCPSSQEEGDHVGLSCQGRTVEQSAVEEGRLAA
jgi:hypothetical protein